MNDMLTKVEMDLTLKEYTTSLYIHLKRPAINVKNPMDSMSGDEND